EAKDEVVLLARPAATEHRRHRIGGEAGGGRYVHHVARLGRNAAALRRKLAAGEHARGDDRQRCGRGHDPWCAHLRIPVFRRGTLLRWPIEDWMDATSDNQEDHPHQAPLSRSAAKLRYPLPPAGEV